MTNFFISEILKPDFGGQQKENSPDSSSSEKKEKEEGEEEGDNVAEAGEDEQQEGTREEEVVSPGKTQSEPERETIPSPMHEAEEERSEKKGFRVVKRKRPRGLDDIELSKGGLSPEEALLKRSFLPPGMSLIPPGMGSPPAPGLTTLPPSGQQHPGLYPPGTGSGPTAAHLATQSRYLQHYHPVYYQLYLAQCQQYQLQQQQQLYAALQASRREGVKGPLALDLHLNNLNKGETEIKYFLLLKYDGKITKLEL